jgi:hypothetical protein
MRSCPQTSPFFRQPQPKKRASGQRGPGWLSHPEERIEQGGMPRIEGWVPELGSMSLSVRVGQSVLQGGRSGGLGLEQSGYEPGAPLKRRWPP